MKTRGKTKAELQAAFDRWLLKLHRASREVEKLRKALARRKADEVLNPLLNYFEKEEAEEDAADEAADEEKEPSVLLHDEELTPAQKRKRDKSRTEGAPFSREEPGEDVRMSAVDQRSASLDAAVAEATEGVDLEALRAKRAKRKADLETSSKLVDKLTNALMPNLDEMIKHAPKPKGRRGRKPKEAPPERGW